MAEAQSSTHEQHPLEKIMAFLWFEKTYHRKYHTASGFRLFGWRRPGGVRLQTNRIGNRLRGQPHASPIQAFFTLSVLKSFDHDAQHLRFLRAQSVPVVRMFDTGRRASARPMHSADIPAANRRTFAALAGVLGPRSASGCRPQAYHRVHGVSVVFSQSLPPPFRIATTSMSVHHSESHNHLAQIATTSHRFACVLRSH